MRQPCLSPFDKMAADCCACWLCLCNLTLTLAAVWSVCSLLHPCIPAQQRFTLYPEGPQHRALPTGIHCCHMLRCPHAHGHAILVSAGFNRCGHTACLSALAFELAHVLMPCAWPDHVQHSEAATPTCTHELRRRPADMWRLLQRSFSLGWPLARCAWTLEPRCSAYHLAHGLKPQGALMMRHISCMHTWKYVFVLV